jgi:hypothetical protein
MDICDWKVGDVQGWLTSHNLEIYKPTFLKNCIDGDTLTDMDDLDLVILEIEDSDKHLILNLIKEAKSSFTEKKERLLDSSDDSDISILDDITYRKCHSDRSDSPKTVTINDRRCHSDRSDSPKTVTIIDRRYHSNEISLPKKNGSLYNKRLMVDSRKKRGSRDITPPIFRIQIDPNEDIEEWSEKDVSTFLKKNSMTKYCREFSKNAVDGECLLEMTIKDFRFLKLTETEAEIMFLAVRRYIEHSP